MSRVGRIINLVKKEFRLLWADKPNLLLAIVMPPLIIWLFAWMISMAAPVVEMPVYVVTYDSNSAFLPNNMTTQYESQYTPVLVDAINSTEGIKLYKYQNATEHPYAMMEARALFAQKEVLAVVSIPADFSELLGANATALVDCMVDASNALNVQGYLSKVFAAIENFRILANLSQLYQVDTQLEFGIPEGYYEDFNLSVTMILSFIIFGITTVLTILVVVQEAPIPRLLLTPTSRSEVLLSKYITYSIVLNIQICLVLATTFANGLYCAGRVVDLYVGLLLVGMTGVALGMFISTLSKTKTQANQYFYLFLILATMLSGIFIPLDSMPTFLQILAYAFPLAHGDPLIRAVVSKGLPLDPTHLGWLVGVFLGYFVLSFIVMRRRQEEV